MILVMEYQLALGEKMKSSNILIRVSNSISERVNKFMLDPYYRLNCKESSIGLEAEKHSIIYYALERLHNCEKFRLENGCMYQ